MSARGNQTVERDGKPRGDPHSEAKLTPEMHDKIVDVVAAGCSMETAAAYAGVNMRSPVRVCSTFIGPPAGSICLAIPKSNSRTLPSTFTKMLDGFRSR